jgi:hypothetical protein
MSFLSQEARESGKREQYEFITVNHLGQLVWDVLSGVQNRPQRRLYSRAQGSSEAL